MSTCISPIAIPELDCEPVFSIMRVQDYLPTNIDTTEVIEAFGFAGTDVNKAWDYEVVLLGDTPDTAPDNPAEDGCEVGDNLVVQQSGVLKYISYLDAALENAGNREWVAPVSCDMGPNASEDSSPPAGYRGVVPFANPRTRNMSLPTFIPRSGGSGPIVTEDECGPDNLSIQVKPKNGESLDVGTFVNYEYGSEGSDASAEMAKCWRLDDYNLPWGVIQAVSTVGDVTTACCTISGIVTTGHSLTTRKPGDRYTPINSSDVEADHNGALIFLGRYTDSEGEDISKWLLTPVAEEVRYFYVTDASTYGTSGSVMQYNVEVSGGILNDVEYLDTALSLSSSNKHWIYAIEGQFYALTHQFHSDLYAVLLCATVEIYDGKLKIDQTIKPNHCYVSVKESQYGAVTLSGNLPQTNSDNTNELTVDYKVEVKGMLNNSELTYQLDPLPGTSTETSYKYLYAYIAETTVDQGVEPVHEFKLLDSPQSQTAGARYELLLQYSHANKSFYVKYRIPHLHMFTFTTLHLNANDGSTAGGSSTGGSA